MKKTLSLLFAAACMLLGVQSVNAAKSYHYLGGQSQNGWSWGYKATYPNSGTIPYELYDQWASISLMGGYSSIDAKAYPNYKVTFAETAPEGMHITYKLDGNDKYPGNIGGKTVMEGKMGGTEVTDFVIQATKSGAGSVVIEDVVFYGDDESAGIHPTYVAPTWGGGCAKATLTFTSQYAVAYAKSADKTANQRVTVTSTSPFPEGVNLYFKTEEGEEGYKSLSGKTEYSEEIKGTIYCIGIQCGAAASEDEPVVAEGVSLYTEDLPKEEPADNLAELKDALKSAIAAGKMQHAFAKTEDSFEALQQAIADGETALEASDATETSLTAAADAIKEAISALVLEEGYSNLTAEMFKKWDDNYNPTTSTSAGCAYVVGASTGQPYGDSSVNYLNFADISEYDKLILTVTEGTPRIMLNRLEVGNGGGDGNGGSFVEITDAPVDGIVEVNLAAYDYAHLNAIKGANYNNVTVTGMYLYKAADPLESYKEVLEAAIQAAEAQVAFGKSEESFSLLTSAIAAGKEALNTADTQEALTDAATAIKDAVSGLELADGFAKLTNEMFKQWDDNNLPTTSSSANSAYVLNESTSQPYGDGNVYYKNFADISDFSKLYVLISDGVARIQMNRETDGGTTHIVTSSEAITEVDFATEPELEGFNFVHLNAIKDNWNKVTVSGMYLYRTLSIGDAGMASFGTLNNTARLNGATVYAAKYEDGSVQLTAVDSKEVPAGVGVLVEGTGEIVPTFDVEAGEIDSDLSVSNGTVTGDGSIYVLANGTQGVGFYKLASGVAVPAGKAYLKASASGREFIGFGSDATAIKNIEAVKADGAVYNLAGQQVKHAQKGVFIVNGKKVIK